MLIERLAKTVLIRGFLVAVLAIPALPSLANADDDAPSLEETDDLPVVQNREYRMEHEFRVGVGTLPIDAFFKGISLSGGYTWHLSDIWGIEGDFVYLKNFNSSLRDDLEQSFGIPSTEFAEIKWYGKAGALFKPFYGKLAFLNDQQVHGEFFFSLSGVVAQMEGGESTEEEPLGKGKRFGIGGAPGFGLRGYINRYLSVRFDFSWMIIYSAGDFHYPLSLSLSFAVSTRSGP